MPNIKQLKQRVARLKKQGAKDPTVVFFHRGDGDVWTLEVQVWDGTPGSYNPDTDCYVMTCGTLEEAQGVADYIENYKAKKKCENG